MRTIGNLEGYNHGENRDQHLESHDLELKKQAECSGVLEDIAQVLYCDGLSYTGR